MVGGNEGVGDKDYEVLIHDIAHEMAKDTVTRTAFKNRIRNEKIKIFSFSETQMTLKVTRLLNGSYGQDGDYVMLVDRDSVELGIPGLEEVLPVDGNHSSIVKFKNEQNSAYLMIRDRLNEIIQILQGIENLNFVIPFQIPIPRNPSFVGRAQELEALRNRVFGSETKRNLTITGAEGMGKTEIAVEYAYRYHRDYTAVLWVSAVNEDTIHASFVDIMQLIIKEQAKITWPDSTPNYHVIGSGLGLSGLIDEEGKMNTNLKAANNIRLALFNWLMLPGNGRWLLIYNDADGLWSFGTKGYLSSRSSGAVLVTRRAEALPWERVPGQLYLHGLDSESAVDLLLNLARSIDTPRRG
ncbi:hypothetical protein TWF718_000413 [Orbilia javanica]|uniref:NB-ARC domain-containing protein n=1 Tax=Orbilia javanica TaxID=47235 RepID=A0AAN8RFV2_9PEZI